MHLLWFAALAVSYTNAVGVRYCPIDTDNYFEFTWAPESEAKPELLTLFGIVSVFCYLHYCYNYYLGIACNNPLWYRMEIVA